MMLNFQYGFLARLTNRLADQNIQIPRPFGRKGFPCGKSYGAVIMRFLYRRLWQLTKPMNINPPAHQPTPELRALVLRVFSTFKLHLATLRSTCSAAPKFSVVRDKLLALMARASALSITSRLELRENCNKISRRVQAHSG
jgi:hypothetical protein